MHNNKTKDYKFFISEVRAPLNRWYFLKDKLPT